MGKIGESPGSWRVRHDRIPLDLAGGIYKRVLQLAQKDSSPVKVARALSASHGLSLSPGTVRHWIKGERRFQIQRRSAFKQVPSPALSYVVGANIGDGCTLTSNWIVKLEVTDYDFAKMFNKSMAKLFGRVRPNRILRRHSVGRLPMYVVKYASKQLVKLLRLPLKKLLEIACVFPQEFLRGFFDAEGHVDVSAGRYFQLFVGAENSDRFLLRKVGELLRTLGIDSRIQRKREAGSIKVIRNTLFVMRRTSYSVMIGRMGDVKRFAAEVGFSIHRKTQKLEDALSIIASASTGDRTAEWNLTYFKSRGEWMRRSSSVITSKSI